MTTLFYDQLSDDRVLAALADYEQQSAARSLDGLLQALAGAGEEVWLGAARRLVLGRHAAASASVLEHALDEHPRCSDLRLALAGLRIETGDANAAEVLLRALLAQAPGHIGGSFLLAHVMKDQGRMHAASQAVTGIFEHHPRDPELTIQAIELLDDCGCKRAAANLSEACIHEGSLDPRLHAYSAMLLAQLGEFERSRGRYEFVIAHSSCAPDWHVPQGLASLQRYQSDKHPDFALFQRYLQQELNDPAKISLLYALGKAHDDIGDIAQAVRYFRQANALDHARNHWSRKRWSRNVDARKHRQRPPVSLSGTTDWTPVFVVGAPRSGSTLLAQRLGRYPQVCHRGELPWLPRLVAALDSDRPDYPQQLQHVAAAYTGQLRQDDSDARWFIDKQPHNYMEIDVILAMFPQARIIHCQRNARDCGLSMWMQAFQAGQQDFASDFTDIADMIHGERQLMTHWKARYSAAIRTVRYEDLTHDPVEVIQRLCDWLGVSGTELREPHRTGDVIATASLWQARQPIHTRSIGRWKHYAQYLPELLQLPDD